MNGKGPYSAELKIKTDLGPNYVLLEIEAPRIASEVRPGQFVHLRLQDPFGALLRRPLSIARARGSRLTILMKKVGLLSRELGKRPAGTVLDVLGPLGNGFDMGSAWMEQAILAAGGYGAAPMVFLAERMHEENPGRKVTLMAGAKSKDDLIWEEEIEKLDWLDYRTATEDGSKGLKGTVLDLMRKNIGRNPERIGIYACGPVAMLGAIAGEWPGVRSQVSVENQMGCGVGVCLGCVIPMKTDAAGGRFARVCREGPVFEASAVDWPLCLEAR